MAKDLMADAISGPTYQVMSNAESHCKGHQRFLNWVYKVLLHDSGSPRANN